MVTSVTRPLVRMKVCVKMESATMFAGVNQTLVARTVRLVGVTH